MDAHRRAWTKSVAIVLGGVLLLGTVWWARCLAQPGRVEPQGLVARFLELEPDSFQMSAGHDEGEGYESFVVRVTAPPKDEADGLHPFLDGDTVIMVLETRRGYVRSARAQSSNYRKFLGEPVGMDRAASLAARFVAKHYALPELAPTFVTELQEEEKGATGTPVQYRLSFGGRKGEAQTGNRVIVDVTAQGRIVAYIARLAPQQDPPPPEITPDEALEIAVKSVPIAGQANYRVEYDKPQLVLSSSESPSGGPIWRVSYKTWVKVPDSYPGYSETGWERDFGGCVTVDALTGKVLPLKIEPT